MKFLIVDADERPYLAIRYTPQIYPCISIISERGIGRSLGFVESIKIGEIISNSTAL